MADSNSLSTSSLVDSPARRRGCSVNGNRVRFRRVRFVAMGDDTTKKKGVRLTMTKSQAEEGLGRELVELSRNWLEDGKLEPHELEQLRAWLAKVPPDSIPAIRFVKEEVERCVAVGLADEWAATRIQGALIRVLPLADREVAKVARDKVGLAEWEKLAPEREARRRASAERSKTLRERYAEQWAGESATEDQIEFIRDLGENIPSNVSKLEASNEITKLLARKQAARGS